MAGTYMGVSALRKFEGFTPTTSTTGTTGKLSLGAGDPGYLAHMPVLRMTGTATAAAPDTTTIKLEMFAYDDSTSTAGTDVLATGTISVTDFNALTEAYYIPMPDEYPEYVVVKWTTSAALTGGTLALDYQLVTTSNNNAQKWDTADDIKSTITGIGK